MNYLFNKRLEIIWNTLSFSKRPRSKEFLKRDYGLSNCGTSSILNLYAVLIKKLKYEKNKYFKKK